MTRSEHRQVRDAEAELARRRALEARRPIAAALAETLQVAIGAEEALSPARATARAIRLGAALVGVKAALYQVPGADITADEARAALERCGLIEAPHASVHPALAAPLNAFVDATHTTARAADAQPADPDKRVVTIDGAEVALYRVRLHGDEAERWISAPVSEGAEPWSAPTYRVSLTTMPWDPIASSVADIPASNDFHARARAHKLFGPNATASRVLAPVDPITSEEAFARVARADAPEPDPMPAPPAPKPPCVLTLQERDHKGYPHRAVCACGWRGGWWATRFQAETSWRAHVVGRV